MSELVLIGANCEAFGHPSECTEPAPGTVDLVDTTTISVNGTTIACEENADMHFDSHAHDHSSTEGCHDNQSHDLDPESAKLSSSLTYNGSPLYVKDTSVTTDPGSGGNVDIVDTGGNTSVTET